MKIEELDFSYPAEQIAKYPISPRDAARLLVLNRATEKIRHSQFSELPKILRPGDLLVFNKSKVFPARLKIRDRKMEILFLAPLGGKEWEVIFGGKVKDGEEISLEAGLIGIVKKGEKNTFKVNLGKEALFKYLEKYGETPLPPYIKRNAEKRDKIEYQNVFASRIGSAAAPTAGLHFTERLLTRLKEEGIDTAFVTLHVGLGTFAPVRTKKVEEHNIHTEYYEIDKNTISKIKKAKKEGRRVIAVGTTAVRVLETINLAGRAQSGETTLFVTPGYNFKVVDALITNFHTPRSSLLALVYAFGGKEFVRRGYEEAIEDGYRLFSYGDGMFIE